MRIRKTLILTAIAVLTVSALITSGTASAEDLQEVTVNISGMSYSPSEVSVQKAVPVKITFVRDDKPTCGGKILFPQLGIEREVAANESVTIEFTPNKSGTLDFTCGMKMMKGKIVVQSN